VRCRAATLAAFLVLLTSAAAASADSISVSVDPATPTGGLPYRVTASGTSSGGEDAYVAIGPDNSCPPEQGQSFYNVFHAPVDAGSYAVTSPDLTIPHGSYFVCAWLESEDPQIAPTDTYGPVPLTVANGNSVSLSVSPAPADGLPVTVTATGVTDESSQVWINQKPAGGSACAATPAADDGTQLGSGTPNQNPWSISARTTLTQGGWLLCAWLAGDSSGPVLASTSLQVEAKPFSGSISMPASFTLTDPHRTHLPVSWHMNAPRDLFVNVSRQVGATCPPRFADIPENDRHDPLGFSGGIWGHEIGFGGDATFDPDGSYDLDLTDYLVNPLTGYLVPGTYTVCSWLADDVYNGDHTLAGPVSTTITVPASAGGPKPKVGPSILSFSSMFWTGHRRSHLDIVLSAKATIIVRLDRVTGRNHHRWGTRRFKGHRGKNHLVFRGWRGHLFTLGRYALYITARSGKLGSRLGPVYFTISPIRR
jgi:hypothetical protein